MEATIVKLLTDSGAIGIFGVVLILLCRLGLLPTVVAMNECLKQWTEFQRSSTEPIQAATAAIQLATERMRDVTHDLLELADKLQGVPK